MEVSFHTATNEQYNAQKLEVTISKSIYNQICLDLRQSDDRLWVFLNREQLEQLFGKINQYFEAERAEREAERYSEVMHDQMLSGQESLS